MADKGHGEDKKQTQTASDRERDNYSPSGNRRSTWNSSHQSLKPGRCQTLNTCLRTSPQEAPQSHFAVRRLRCGEISSVLES